MSNNDIKIDNMVVIESFISILRKIAKELENSNSAAAVVKTETVVMLTVKEAVQLISGLTEGTLRKLLKQGKVASIRAGEGHNGKYLINKDELLRYFNENHKN